MKNIISSNKKDWKELEYLIRKAKKSRKGVRSLSSTEIKRMDILYRRTAILLSQISTKTKDQSLIEYLNNLTASSHSLMYISTEKSRIASLIHLITTGFPMEVALNWKFYLISGLLFLAGSIIGLAAVYQTPMAAYALMPAGEVRLPGTTRETLISFLRSGRTMGDGEKFFFASFLFQHNLKVGLLSLALGVAAAIPTVILIFYNGMILGAFTAIHLQSNITSEYWAWILPHGITEILAIVLFGGVGLQIGYAVISGGPDKRTERIVKTGKSAVKICLGGFVMLLLAAGIESYIRQSYLPTSARLSFAFLTAGIWILFFLRGAMLNRKNRLAESNTDIREELSPGFSDTGL